MNKKLKKFILSALSLGFVACAIGGVYKNYTADALNRIERPQIGTDIPPTITLDTQGYDLDSPPQAVLGLSYNVFDATATDISNSEVNVKTSVYLHYYSDTKRNVADYCDSFVPQFYGVYTVEYTATDTRGNVAVTTYDVLCEEKQPFTPILDTQVETAIVGSEVQVKDIQFANESGVVDYEVVATSAEGKHICNVENGVFTPMVVGEYTVEYICSDYVETKTVSYTLSVGATDEILFFDTIQLDEYFIVNAQYQLPALSAYHFALGEAARIECTVSVVFENGKTVVLDANRTFKPTKAETLQIIYSASYLGKTARKTFTAQAVDVQYLGKMDMSKYFVSDEAVISATSRYISIQTEEDCSVDFINKILSANMRVDFLLNLAKTNFSKLHVYVSDSENAAEQVKFSFVKQTDKKSVFLINDEYRGKTNLTFSSSDNITFNYTQSTNTATFAGALPSSVDSTLDGKPFNGFTSGFVYVKVVMEDVKGSTELRISKVNNQSVSNINGDGVPPQVVFSEYKHGDHIIGDIITVDGVAIGDVLTPSGLTVEYYIKRPTGEYVKSLDGKLVSKDSDYARAYTFVASENGAHVVYIHAEDVFGNSCEYSYTIWVRDKIAPVFEDVVGYIEVSMGDKVEVPEVYAFDDVSDNVEIATYVTYKGNVLPVEDSSFVAKYAGKYTITYYATDEAGNVTMASTVVFVKE